MKEDAVQVLADERGQAAVLRHNGHEHDAKLIERICDRFAEAAEEYLNFMSESEAMLRTGKSERYLRSRFQEFAARGHAKKIGAVRYYREVMLEPRANLSAAREAGRRAAAGGAK